MTRIIFIGLNVMVGGLLFFFAGPSWGFGWMVGAYLATAIPSAV